MAERCVAHLDMDAFYVSVELQRRPRLRGLPVVVAGSGPRAVVTTASYEARRFGVGSALPASRARRLCPDAVFLTPDFDFYRTVSRKVMEIVRTRVASVEVVGLDEAYLELSDLPAPAAVMRQIAAEIANATGLGCSVGIGPSKLVAKVASDAEKPGGFVMLTREQACERFASARCGLVPGIGPKTEERLRQLGIGTLGKLRAADLGELGQRFGGRFAAELQRRARFEDASPVSEERKVISESRETTFDRDISDPQRLEQILHGLVGQLSEALMAQGRCGRTVGIKIRLDDFSTHTRARTVPDPVSSAERIGPIALELLRRFAARRPVRLLGARVAGLEPVGRQAGDQLKLAL
ncbi:MAG: DNA polymerase IV [Solirubrobacterales bacterium]|nr:DNA polymerase IV [Solirubrobacterales bacterium]